MNDTIGTYQGQYNDLQGSWNDGDVTLTLNADKTYTCSRQYNSGRDDPGHTDQHTGTWSKKSCKITINPRPKDFLSDFIIGSNGLSFEIQHIGYETPKTQLVLAKI